MLDNSIPFSPTLSSTKFLHSNMATVSERLRKEISTGYQTIKSSKQAIKVLVSHQSHVARLLCRVGLDGKYNDIPY